MANEEGRVALIAELRDDVSAPLKDLEKQFDSTTKLVERSGKRQSQAVQKSSQESQQAWDKLSEKTSAMERTFQKVGGKNAFQGIKDGIESARKKVAQSVDAISEDTKTKLKVGAAAAGVAAAGALGAAFAGAVNVDAGNRKLAAQLGLTGADAKKAGDVAGKLYAGAYGGSLEEVNTAVSGVMSSIRGMKDASSKDIEAMTGKVLDLASVFDLDVGRTAQVAGQMITTGLAKDGTEAADLLAGNLQKVPAALREDLLDAVDEYGPFFANMGIEGSDAMGMLARASEKGMYGIDKTGDALKEFTIRSTDMSKATRTAYEDLGLDHDKLVENLLAGGPAANQAMGDIIHALQTTKDPAERAASALALFGTPLEDLSVNEIPNFLGMLDPAGDAFDTMAGKAEAMGKTINGGPKVAIEGFRRKLETGVVSILGDHVIPALQNTGQWFQDLGGWVQQNAAWLIPLTAAVVGYAGAMGALAIISTVRGWITAASAAQWGLNAAMAANPVGLVVAALAVLIAGVVLAYNNIGWFRDGVDAAWRGIQTVAGVVVDWFVNTVWPRLQAVIQGIATVFMWLWNNAISPTFNFIGGAFNAFWMLASGIFQLLGAAIGLWWNTIVMPIFNAVNAFIHDVLGPAFTWLYENVVKPVWDWIGGIISDAWETRIKPIFDAMMHFITEVIPDAFRTGVGVVGAIWEGIKAIAAAPVNFVIDTVINDGIIKTFNKVADFLGVENLPYVHNPLKAAKHTGVATSGGPNRAFANGGYTGDGGVHEASGVVHGKEYVFDAATTRKGGGKSGMAALAQAIKASPTGAMPTLNTGVPGMIASIGRNHAYVEDNAPGWFVPRAAQIISQMSALKLSMGRSGMPRIQTHTGTAMPGNILGYASGNNVVFNQAHAGMNPGMKLTVAIHELLHVLGQGHTNAASIMQPVLGAHMMPTAYDVGQMQRLYGAGDGASFAPTGEEGDGGGWNPFTGIMDGLVSLVRDKFSDTFIADLAVGVGQKIFDTIGSKFDIFDTGGMLQPGQGAVNLSGKPERVLSPSQTETFDDLVYGGGGGRSITFAPVFSPQVTSTSGDGEEIAEELREMFDEWLAEKFDELERTAY